jgi:hypothetical protein
MATAHRFGDNRATGGYAVAGIAGYIRHGERELEHARRDGNENQAERWQGYLDVLVGADVALAEQPGYAVADRCARYLHRQECILRSAQVRTWSGFMDRTGRREAIRRLWHLCS